MRQRNESAGPVIAAAVRAAARAMLAVLALLPAAGVAQADSVFTLSSPTFKDGGIIPQRYAGNDKANPNCTGENASPALAIFNAPEATKSFALLIFDQQGRNGLGVSHQVAYGIPATAKGFGPGQLTAGTGFVGGKGTTGRLVYYGPCPGHGSGLHHYEFTLIATDLEAGALEPGLTREQLLERLNGHALAAAGFVGRFGQ